MLLLCSLLCGILQWIYCEHGVFDASRSKISLHYVGYNPSWPHRAQCTSFRSQAGVYREGREVKRGIRTYFKDQWNVLDLLGLLCLFVGLVIRWAEWTNPWGPAFYALSSPLVVSRVLFFAQVLQFQGPMIQVSSPNLFMRFAVIV